MRRSFRGESVHKVDAKGRVSIPAPFRRVLEEGDPDWTEGLAPSFVMVYGRPGRACIDCYTIVAMHEVEEMVRAMPRFSAERAALERFLATKSTYAEVDPTGRIVLPQKVRDSIGLGDEAVFAGAIDTFRIWSPDGYAAHEAEIDRFMAEAGAEADPFLLLDHAKLGGGA